MRQNFQHGILALSLLAGIAIGHAAHASTTKTATFTVTATVNGSCTISATNIAFGTYDPSAGAATANGTITATCTNTTPYNVALNSGATSGATVTTRQMVNGSTTPNLNYGLYQDAAFTTNWGQTVGTDTEAGTGNGSAQTLTVYGQVPAGQYVTPGSFTDTVTASIIY